jgi:hypothetical protein
LPGVGWKGNQKLQNEGLVTVEDILQLGDSGEKRLCEILGKGNGSKIYQFCIGRDPRPLSEVKQKSVSAECNYGVRFDGPLGIDHFMMELSKELQKRLTSVDTRGSKVTLRLKKRKEGAKEPPKFLGHGSCHNLSKSVELQTVTRDAETIYKSGMLLLKMMPINSLHEVRGMGITMSNLVEYGEEPKPTVGGLKQWLANSSSPVKLREQKETSINLNDGNISDDSFAFDNFDGPGKVKPSEEDIASPEVEELDDESSDDGKETQFDASLLPPIIKRLDTYEEDILPLMDFLKEHDASDEDARQSIIEFLSIVVKERPASLKPMVRKVGEFWPDVVEQIVDTITKVCHKTNGYHLDTQWILGK